MARAVICPVCNGTGKIWISNDSTSGRYEAVCQGCRGLGWVEVSDR